MDEPEDPYLDPATGILRNLLGARTQADLDGAEAAHGDLAGLELLRHPVPATGDFDELKGIHRHLLGNVYAWAGQTRTVDIRKGGQDATPFVPVVLLDRGRGASGARLRPRRARHLPPRGRGAAGREQDVRRPGHSARPDR